MHNPSAAQLGLEAQDDDAASSDHAHERRVAWITSMWVLLALVAAAIALWDGWWAVP